MPERSPESVEPVAKERCTIEGREMKKREEIDDERNMWAGIGNGTNSREHRLDISFGGHRVSRRSHDR